MENQSKFHTPRFARDKKNSLAQSNKDEKDDFFQKINCYSDVHHRRNENDDFTNSFRHKKIDDDLISSIYDTPKVKIGESRNDMRNLKFQKDISKVKTKMNKSQQNDFYKRLSSPRIAKKVIDPQFVYIPPPKTSNISEYNKEFINSHFTNVDEIINLNQLESILIDFAIIDHSVKEKPQISSNLFPLCQINDEKNCMAFDSKMLKEALIQSFYKSSENPFWKEISNCIKSARMNRKKKSCSFTPNMVQNKKNEKKEISEPHHSSENLSNDKQPSNDKSIGNCSCSNNDSTEQDSKESIIETISIFLASNNISTYQEEQTTEINEQPLKFKFNLITDHFSETMIDDQFNSETTNEKESSQDKIDNQISSQEIQIQTNENQCVDVVNEEKQSSEKNCEIQDEFQDLYKENENTLEKDQNKKEINQEENIDTEDDYNSNSDDQYCDKNIGIDDLLKEIENGTSEKDNNSSNKEIFDFNSYYSLEFESENSNSKTINKNVCSDPSKKLNIVSIKKNERNASSLENV